MTFTLLSPAFKDNDSIPSEYTCDGDDISPPLNWQNEPDGTKSFALIVDDPDAPKGVWDHWIVFNIPANVHELPADIVSPPYDAKVGKNSWDESTYGGPCPPDGEHRYFFKLYALDTTLDLSNPDKSELEAAMKGHILATAKLIGKYKRQGG